MKSLKIKLFLTISTIVLVIAMFIVGVWAVGGTQHINLNGSVNFTIADDTLYVRDVRIKEANNLTGKGTTIDNFLPSFVNGEVELDIGELSANTSFTLIFDVVNTSSTIYDASTQSTISNAVVEASGRIMGDGVSPTEVTTADISGQIVLTITVSTAGNVNLDGITITLTEYIPQVYDYFTFEVNDDESTVSLTAFDESLLDSPDIVIPETVDLVDGVWQEGETYTVTAIAGASAPAYAVFFDCEKTSVELPSTLQSIGNYAFHSSNLSKVDFSKCTNLTIIESYAFQQNSNLTELDLSNCTSLTTIENMAFELCTGITKIHFPSSLRSVGSTAFSLCRGLVDVIIDSGMMYRKLTTSSSYGSLLSNSSIANVKVLTSLVEENGANNYITNNFPSVSTEVIDGKDYTVYSK